jgi:hypothetical protein
MQWIDEMFAGMEKDRAAELVKRSAKETHVHRTEHLKEENPDTEGLWSALTSAISKDVNEFNLHKERTGQIAVHISNRHHQCEVYLPGMQSKRLVLALEDNELKVSIHPDFPSQQLAITIEHDQEGRHGFWVLGDHSKENAKRSTQQLSEYLLKPVLSCARSIECRSSDVAWSLDQMSLRFAALPEYLRARRAISPRMCVPILSATRICCHVTRL